MKKLNASIADIPLPARLRHLRISDTGFPVPWFVADVDGKPDFRVADAKKFTRALQADLCWLCGNTLGRFKCFVTGPMCAISMTTAEPPCHRDCVEYAVAACPFLVRPRARRNTVDMPAEHVDPGGVMITRNPGVTLLWITHSYQTFRPHNGGTLIKMGEPVEIVAYAEGRLATRDELYESIRTGLPLLAKEADRDGDEGRHALADAMARVDTLFKSKLKLAA